MAKRTKIVVGESPSELARLAEKLRLINKKLANRVVMLIYLIEEPEIKLGTLADKLDIDRRTINRWMNEYKEGGLEKLIGKEYLQDKGSAVSEEALESNKQDKWGEFISNTIKNEAKKLLKKLTDSSSNDLSL